MVAVGLVVASISGLLDWLAGPSTGLVQIGRERGYLPRYFQQVNANGVQLRILVAQGVVITVIGLLYALVPTVSRAYWIFVALATEVYLIMYVLMFVAARNLRRRQSEHPRGYRAPALIMICVVGVLASVAACIVGLLPPSQLGHTSTPVYVSRCWPGCFSSECSRPSCCTGCAGPVGAPGRRPRGRPGLAGCRVATRSYADTGLGCPAVIASSVSRSAAISASP